MSCTVCRRAKEPRAKVIVSMAFATTVGSQAIRPISVLQKVERHDVKDKAQRETAMVGMTAKVGQLEGTVRWQGLEFIRQRLGATKARRNEQFGA